MSSQSTLFISYSANHEDVLLNRLFGTKQVGFYVDVGAAHPMFENDTKALYDRGWFGINIEPNKSFFDILAAERPRDTNLNIAISDLAGESHFYEVQGTGLSTCDPEEAARARAKGFDVIEHIVKTCTLRDLLDAANSPAIDLLKIDVEGFEPNVIRSNDWSRFRPNVILVEATFPETPVRRPDVAGPLLENAGYRRVYFDGLNDYYLENSFVAPEGAFDAPPNLFDHFTTIGHAQLAQERDFLRQEGQSLKVERENALIEITALRIELGQQLYLRDDIARARDALLAMRRQMTELARQMENIEAERAAVETRLEATWRSTSWRVTRPLRAIAHPRRSMRILTGK